MDSIKKLELPGIDDSKPLIIAGPCSAESREQVLETAIALAAKGIKIFRAGIWKPRTRPGCFEGIGVPGLAWMKEVKEKTGMLTATEVANPTHVFEAVQAGIDICWIGARTVTNPFAMQELADAFKGIEIPVLVKNPVNPDLELWCGAIERLKNAGISNIGAIHRGFSSFEQKIYRNPPHWVIPIELRRKYPELSIICDPSHIGGRKELIEPISQQALDLNFDGLMIESHCDPSSALSDADQQIEPETLSIILQNLVIKKNLMPEDLNFLRHQIDEIDEQLLALIAKRMGISMEIGEFKKTNRIPVLQTGRYNQMLQAREDHAKSLSIDHEFVSKLMKIIHEESARVQMDLL